MKNDSLREPAGVSAEEIKVIPNLPSTKIIF
jgi:hypothetical protein